ncbi:glycosyltransferase [Teichococcus aestuarii]|uniref:glycosyltransferase n=1 Tax=Teichococcus aestuarii TaxID=568898 RepID=UPI00361D10F4
MNARALRPVPGNAGLSAAPMPLRQGGRGGHAPAPLLWVLLPLLALAQGAAWWAAGGGGAIAWGGGAALAGLLGGAWALRGAGGLRWPGLLMVALPGQLLAGGLAVLARQGLASHPAWLALLVLLLPMALLLLWEARLLADSLFARAYRRRHPALGQAGGPEPRVSVHLPTQDMPPALLRDTLDHLAELDYGALEVLVLDSSHSPESWEPVAEHCARLGPRFRFFHLGAGQRAARNFALREMAPDAALVATLEPGCRVQPDWLRHAVPFFRDPGLGFVQGTACAPERGALLAERVAHAADASRWPRVQRARNEHRAVPLRLALALIRRPALEMAGCWNEAAPCKPAELGLRLLRQGWDGLELADGLAAGHVPAVPQASVAGLLHGLRRHGAALLNPRHRGLSPAQRRHLLAEPAAAAGDALWLALAVLALPWTLALAAARLLEAAPLLPFLLPALMLPLFRLAQAALLAPRGHRALAGLAALATMPERGAALWRAALAPTAETGRPHRLVSLLLALLAGAAGSLGLGGAQGLGWAGVLLLLAVPCAAALALRRQTRPAPAEWEAG